MKYLLTVETGQPEDDGVELLVPQLLVAYDKVAESGINSFAIRKTKKPVEKELFFVELTNLNQTIF